MIMGNQKYPLYAYNAKGEARYVPNDSDLIKAKQDGFTPKYIHSSFPKWLYGPKGESVLVNDEAEFQAKLADGYGEDFVKAPAPAPVKETSNGADSSLVRALMAENRDLTAKVTAVEEFCDGLATTLEDLKTQVSKLADASLA